MYPTSEPNQRKRERTVREEREEHQQELGRGQQVVAVLHSFENAHGLGRFGKKRLVVVRFGAFGELGELGVFGVFGELGERWRQETEQDRAQKHEEREDQIHDADRSVPNVGHGTLQIEKRARESDQTDESQNQIGTDISTDVSAHENRPEGTSSLASAGLNDPKRLENTDWSCR